MHGTTQMQVQKHSRPNSSKHGKVGKNCSPSLALSLSDWTLHKNSKLQNSSCYVYNYMGLSQEHTTAAHMLLGFDTVPDKLQSVWLVHCTQLPVTMSTQFKLETKKLYNDSRKHKTSPHFLPAVR